MKIKIWLASMLLSVITPIFIATPSAIAGCRDYPESITPGCVAQNLAEEQARQVADQAKRAQDLINESN